MKKKPERYQTLEELPPCARKSAEKLMTMDALTGDTEGLNLSRDMVRLLLILEKAGVFDR